MRHAACEIGGAIDGVDDPQMGCRFAAALFAQDRIAREGRSQLGPDEVFDGKVRLGQEILRAFEREGSGGAGLKPRKGQSARPGGEVTQESGAGGTARYVDSSLERLQVKLPYYLVRARDFILANAQLTRQ